MLRDLVVPILALLVGVGVVVACRSGRRCRPVGAPAPLDQSLYTWEGEGGAVPDANGPKPARGREEPGA